MLRVCFFFKKNTVANIDEDLRAKQVKLLAYVLNLSY